MPIDDLFAWAGLLYAALVIHKTSGLLEIKAIAVVTIGITMVYFAPLDAGYIIGISAAALLLLPIQVSRWGTHLLNTRRMSPSVRLLRVAFVLNPDSSFLADLRFAIAMRSFSQHGTSAAAIAAFDQLARSASTPPAAALYSLFNKRLLEDRLDVFLDEIVWSRDHPPIATLLRLRALSYLGRIDELLTVWRDQADRLRASPQAIYLRARALVMAETGQVEVLKHLLTSTTLHTCPTDQHDLWLTRAEMTAGTRSGAPAQRTLCRLAESLDRIIALEAARMLDRPPAIASPMAKQIATVHAEPEGRRSVRSCPATLSLIFLNMLGFTAQLATGGPGASRALEMGRLVPARVLDGEWWRIPAASFLHLGWVHLMVNLLALALLGERVEQMFGPRRMLAAYTVAALGTMSGLVVLQTHGLIANHNVAGASGAVLGLLGALISSAHRQARRSPTQANRSKLHGFVIILVLQIVFDVTNPQVSVAGHALGVLCGLLAGLAMRPIAQCSPVAPSFKPVAGSAPDRPTNGKAILFLGVVTASLLAAVALPGQRERALHTLSGHQHQPETSRSVDRVPN